MSLQSYYNRFNAAKNYDRIMFLSGRGLQSAELNEVQENIIQKLKGVGDAMFGDGDVVEGAAIVVDPDTGQTTIEQGHVYLRGSVRDVGSAEFTLPTAGLVRVGVYYNERTITELEDPQLRDPAVGTRNYQEPGAARLQSSLAWGFEAEGITSESDGEFYPVYNVQNGVLVIQAPPPQSDALTQALARYDREAHQSYVVSGFKVRFLETDTANQEHVFVITEGKAHVNGYEIGLPHGLRMRFPIDPDIAEIESEPHTFIGDEDGVMRLTLNNTPIHEVDKIDITKERTATITHGAFTGATDPLPDEAVLEIIEISQGGTIYEPNQDYRLTAGDVDWSPLGAEPAPGSSYDVTYRYREQLDTVNLNDTSFDIEGAVEGSLILIDYKWKMPRFDLVSMDQEGNVRRVKGLAHPWRPAVPQSPEGQLTLGLIEHTWETGLAVKTTSTATHAVPMSDIEAMRESIHDLYSLVAEERLRNDANAADPSTKLGVFVDPFFDDDLRDQGIPQTGAIIDGELTLPIAAEIIEAARAPEAFTLDYELEPVIKQLLRTKDMKVNPYQAFEPIPARVQLNLSVDRWTDVNTQWTSPGTRRFSRFTSPLTRNRVIGGGLRTRLQSRTTQNVLLSVQRSESNELLSSTSIDAEFMRQQTQRFDIEGFEPGETLETVLFDGIEITPTAIEE